MVTDSLVTHLTPIREEIDRILADQQYMDSVRANGRDVAMDLVWETMGRSGSSLAGDDNTQLFCVLKIIISISIVSEPS